MSSAEENKALVRRFVQEVYNRGNLDVADELLATNFVDHDFLSGEEVGPEDYERSLGCAPLLPISTSALRSRSPKATR
jgi:hypothetical protein